MPSRRKIREATVQLLYAREADPNERDEEKIWTLIHEQSLTNWNRARLKVLVHLQQARPALVEKFQNACKDATAAIDRAEPSGRVARAFSAQLLADKNWCDKLESIPRLAKIDIGAWQNDLKKVLKSSQGLSTSRAKLLTHIAGFPPAQEQTLTAIIGRLNDFDQRARQLVNPLAHPEQPELSHLRQAQAERDELRKTVTDFADQVSAETPRIDPILDKTSLNFSIKRFSKVDLAILRLAAWEILQKNELSPAIIINEAVEIAKRFGTGESASFVNGLLDQIAKGKNALNTSSQDQQL